MVRKRGRKKPEIFCVCAAVVNNKLICDQLKLDGDNKDFNDLLEIKAKTLFKTKYNINPEFVSSVFFERKGPPVATKQSLTLNSSEVVLSGNRAEAKYNEDYVEVFFLEEKTDIVLIMVKNNIDNLSKKKSVTNTKLVNISELKNIQMKNI